VSLSPARQIAFEVLRRVEEEGAYASDALHAALDANLKPADAALATELTMGVLRWRGQIDFLIECLSNKPVSRLDLPVLIALRLGLYQMRFMQKIPARAAVNESVDLVKWARKSSAAPFVNAVLRKAGEQSRKPIVELLPPGKTAAERLAVLHSHPQWLVERWLASKGETATVALLAANNETPRLACVLNDPSAREKVFAELTQAGLRVEPGQLLNNAFSVSGGSPSRTAAFREGRISIQDEASQAVPLLLGVRAGERVLDVCAAPGGKTAALARAAGQTSFVVAADLHAHRLRATKAQFTRLHLASITLVALDAEKPLPFAAHFDRILVDAPCSGTGTLARHPEIRWRLKPEQLGEFHAMQTAILRNAIAQAAPNARIVYSTCSMEPEENESVIEAVLQNPGGDNAKLHRADTAEMPRALKAHLALQVEADRLFDEAGSFRTLPQRDATDGFFAALLVKGK
jgi:16S rRNA (cytosine967-C5)-methyltransferase